MFNTNELQLIINLCDLALKTEGLKAVNAVVPLAGKCQELLQQENKPATEVQTDGNTDS